MNNQIMDNRKIINIRTNKLIFWILTIQANKTF